MNLSTINATGELSGRLLMSGIFIIAGLNKIGAYAGTQQYMESMGVAGELLPLVILLELVGGVAILLGFRTALVAILLAGFCVVSAILFHANLADQVSSIMFMKNLAIAGGLLVLATKGPVSWSLDQKFAARS